MWRLLYVFVALLIGASLTLRAQQPTAPAPAKVFVVRHAEKADLSDPDTPLSPAGEQRAQALAKSLQGERVKAVYATEFKRTQQTAQPTAKAAATVELEALKKNCGSGCRPFRMSDYPSRGYQLPPRGRSQKSLKRSSKISLDPKDLASASKQAATSTEDVVLETAKRVFTYSILRSNE